MEDEMMDWNKLGTAALKSLGVLTLLCAAIFFGVALMWIGGFWGYMGFLALMFFTLCVVGFYNG